MSELAALQRRFLDYIRCADAAIEADVVGETSKARARRLSIYYNAYRTRLRDSIDTDHPVLGRYLGDDLLEQMAAAYIDAHPSAYTSLRHFCNELPEFLRENEAFAAHGVLSDLAAFERLLMDVFDAADTTRRDVGFLPTLKPDEWPELTLFFHPSVRVFATEWNCVEIWQAIKGEQEPPEARIGAGQNWLMWRNRERLTEFRSLSVDELTMLESARSGATFAAQCESLLAWHAEADVAPQALALLRRWLRDGLITETDGASVDLKHTRSIRT